MQITLGLNSLSQNLTVLPAPSGREPLAWRESLRLNRKACGCACSPGGAVAQRLRGCKSAEPEKTVKRSSRRTGVNLQFFPVQPSSLGLKGASSPFFVAPARRNRWHFSGSLLVSKENIPRLRGFSQFSYFFASFIRLRFSSRMRSSTTFTALRMRALGIRTASVAHG